MKNLFILHTYVKCNNYTLIIINYKYYLIIFQSFIFVKSTSFLSFPTVQFKFYCPLEYSLGSYDRYVLNYLCIIYYDTI